MSAQCRDAVPLIGPALDGELPAADRAWLDEHVTGCAACKDRRALLAAQGAALRDRLAAAASQADFSYFATRVLARVSDEQDAPVSLSDRLGVWLREVFGAHRFALGASAGLVAAALIVGVGLRPRPIADQPTDRAVTLASAEQAAHAQGQAQAEQAQQAQIDELEVYGQEGMVLQLPGQSTVIWINDEPASAGRVE